MKKCYLYGICQAGVRVQDLVGVEGLPVKMLLLEKAGLLFSEYQGPYPQPTWENLFSHNRVLEQASAQSAVLPARFGTILSFSEINRYVQKNQEKIQEKFTLVSGQVEMGLKIMAAPSENGIQDMESGKTPSGKSYLKKRMLKYQQETQAAAREEKALAEIWRSLAAISRAAERKKPRGEMIFDGAFLVGREEVDGFIQKVKSLKTEYAHLVFLASGPWPPYTFASWEENSGG